MMMRGTLTHRSTAARRLVQALALSALVTVLAVAPAWCAEGRAAPSEGMLIGQIVLLIVVGRLLGEGMLRLGQPAVMGQLIAGILLGPSVLGALWPEAQHFLFPKVPEQKAMLDGIAQFGILLLLLLAGMETELSLVRDVRRAAFSASLAGIALPFACGFALGYFLPERMLPDPNKRLITSLFLGTALSISSVKIVASVVRDMGFLRRNVGQIILASAIVDDTIGWVIIAITFGLAGQENFSWLSVVGNVAGTLLFLAFSFTLGRRMVFKIIQFSNDHFRGEGPVIAAILVVMGLFALITQAIGVHTVLGAFVAGILVGESPILTEEIDRQFRGLVAGLFMPVFFGLAGLSADLTVLKDPELALLTLAPYRHRELRQGDRRLHGRLVRRTDGRGIHRARDGHERARLDGSHRRHHRPVDGRAQPEPVHDDRRDGGDHDDRDAADVALGARPPADAAGGKAAAGARGI